MYNEIVGTWAQANGTSGTVTLPAGARLLSISAHASSAGATVNIFGGGAIPMPLDPTTTWWVHKFLHGLCVAFTGATTVVFTGTDSYFLEYVKAGNN